MSTDRESRVLGSGEIIEVNGKEYTLRPASVQHLCDLEREALRFYKRQVLETYSENLDLLPKNMAEEKLNQKLDEVSRWDLQDLPQRIAYDVSKVPLSKKVRDWIKTNYGELPDTEAGIRGILLNALDAKQITVSEIKELSGKAPLQGRIRYDSWWITGSPNGMISFIKSSLSSDHPEVTKEQLAKWPHIKLLEAGNIVEKITSADMGNM